MSQPTERIPLSTLKQYMERDWEDRPLIDFKAQASLLTGTITEQLESELFLLALEADTVAARFFETVTIARAEMPKDKQTYLGCRVRVKNNSLEIAWHRNSIIPAEKSKGKGRVYSRYIRKGYGDSYEMDSFKREPQWVQDVVAEAEITFGKLRKRAKLVSKIRGALTEYQQLA